MQVQLETGVANGVMVVRSPNECRKLLSDLLTNELQFRIRAVESSEGERVATALVEERTKSRFRVVAYNPVLTNSFWNFYPI